MADRLLTLDQKIMIKGHLERRGLSGPNIAGMRTCKDAIHWVGLVSGFMPVQRLWTSKKVFWMGLSRPLRRWVPKVLTSAKG